MDQQSTCPSLAPCRPRAEPSVQDRHGPVTEFALLDNDQRIMPAEQMSFGCREFLGSLNPHVRWKASPEERML